MQPEANTNNCPISEGLNPKKSRWSPALATKHHNHVHFIRMQDNIGISGTSIQNLREVRIDRLKKSFCLSHEKSSQKHEIMTFELQHFTFSEQIADWGCARHLFFFAIICNNCASVQNKPIGGTLLCSFRRCWADVMAPKTDCRLTLFLIFDAVPNSSPSIFVTRETWSLNSWDKH